MVAGSRPVLPEGTNAYQVAVEKANSAQIEKEIEEARENERKIIKCLLLGPALAFHP